MTPKLILIASFLFPFNSFAKCFNFAEGQGPARVGNVDFQGYQAKTICLYPVNRGEYDALSLADEQGDLIQAAVRVRVGRCGVQRFCKKAQAQSGNAFGQNLSASEAASVNVSIYAEADGTGVFQDLITGKSYPLN